MTNDDDIDVVNKRKTVIKVLIFHILIAFLLFWQTKGVVFIKEKHLVVQDIVIQSPRPRVMPKKTVTKRSSPSIIKKQQIQSKKNSPQKHIELKKRVLSQLKNVLKEEVTKKDRQNSKEMTIPKKIVLTLDQQIAQTLGQRDINYYQMLVNELQSTLRLPEEGQVKMKMTVYKEGKISCLEVMESKSKANENYLKNTLPHLIFPWFCDFCSKENSKDIIILFRNET